MNKRNLGKQDGTPSNNFILWHLQGNLNLEGRNGQDRSLQLVWHFNPKNIFANGQVNGIYFSYRSSGLNLNYQLKGILLLFLKKAAILSSLATCQVPGTLFKHKLFIVSQGRTLFASMSYLLSPSEMQLYAKTCWHKNGRTMFSPTQIMIKKYI